MTHTNYNKKAYFPFGVLSVNIIHTFRIKAISYSKSRGGYMLKIVGDGFNYELCYNDIIDIVKAISTIYSNSIFYVILTSTNGKDDQQDYVTIDTSLVSLANASLVENNNQYDD